MCKLEIGFDVQIELAVVSEQFLINFNYISNYCWKDLTVFDNYNVPPT